MKVMLSLFSKNKKVLGLDINEEFIRYVKVSKRDAVNKIISYGEEKIAQREPRNSIISALSSIVRQTKTRDAIVCLPADSVSFETATITKTSQENELSSIVFALTEKLLFSHGQAVLFYEKIDSVNSKVVYRVVVSSSENVAFLRSVFENSGVNVLKFVSQADALINSCVKKENLLPTMVINLESQNSIVGLAYPFEILPQISRHLAKDKISELIEDVYVDFYKKYDEKLSYILASGELAQDENFLNYLSRQTRLSIEQADALINFENASGVPIITKDESLLYAVALGLAIS